MTAEEPRDNNDNRSPPSSKGWSFDVFVSFCSADRKREWFGRSLDVVAHLKSALEAHRHPVTGKRLKACTYDEDFELGDRVRTVIADTIARSRTVVLVSGKGAAISPFVRYEMEVSRSLVEKGRLLVAYVDASPHDSFPDIFPPDKLGADLSSSRCANLRAWKARLEKEAAKLAARIWNLPLETVRDRFLLQQKRSRRFRIIIGMVTLLSFSLLGGVAFLQSRESESARVLGIHQRYASTMTAVQRAWTTGDLATARELLRSWELEPTNPDPRSFEWITYAGIISSERISHEKEGFDAVTALAAGSVAPLYAFSRENTPVTLWNAESGRRIALLPDLTKGAASLVFSDRDSSLLVAVDSGILLWNIGDSTQDFFPAPDGIPVVAAVTTSGILAANRRGDLYQVDSREGFRLLKTTAFKMDGGPLQLFGDAAGNILLGIGGDGTIEAISAKHHTPVYTRSVDGKFTDENLAAHDDQLLFTSGDHVVRMRISDGEMKHSNRLTNGPIVSGIAVTSDGMRFAVGDPSSGAVHLYQEGDGRGASPWRNLGTVKGYRGWLDTIHFLPGTNLLVAASRSEQVKVWDLSLIGRRFTQEHPGDIVSIATSPTNDVFSISREGTLRRWDPETLREKWRRSGPREKPDSCAIAGKDLAVSAEGTITLHDAETGEPRGEFAGWGPLVSDPNGKWLAFTTESPFHVAVRNLSTGEIVRLPLEHSAGEHNIDVTSFAFQEGTEHLFAATADGRVMKFHIGKRKLEWTFQAHDRVIHDIAIQSGGQYFATASSDHTIRIWRTDNAAATASLTGHSDSVQSITYSPDGRTLVSGSQDGIVKFWNTGSNLETITFLAHVPDHHPGVTAVAFAKNGKYLLTGGAAGVIVRWDGGTAPASMFSRTDSDSEK